MNLKNIQFLKIYVRTENAHCTVDRWLPFRLAHKLMFHAIRMTWEIRIFLYVTLPTVWMQISTRNLFKKKSQTAHPVWPAVLLSKPNNLFGLRMDTNQFSHQHNKNIYGPVTSGRDCFAAICILNHKDVIFSPDFGYALYSFLMLYVTDATLICHADKCSFLRFSPQGLMINTSAISWSSLWWMICLLCWSINHSSIHPNSEPSHECLRRPEFQSIHFRG